jgi:hypothetical protein
LEFNATQYVCGHINKIGSRDEMIQAMEFAEDVKQAAAVRFPPHLTQPNMTIASIVRGLF